MILNDFIFRCCAIHIAQYILVSGWVNLIVDANHGGEWPSKQGANSRALPQPGERQPGELQALMVATPQSLMKL